MPRFGRWLNLQNAGRSSAAESGATCFPGIRSFCSIELAEITSSSQRSRIRADAPATGAIASSRSPNSVPGLYDRHMSELTVEIDREDDGRWIGEVTDLPGVLAYGSTRDEAVAKAKALAFRVLADRIEHGEDVPQIKGVFAVHE